MGVEASSHGFAVTKYFIRCYIKIFIIILVTAPELVKGVIFMSKNKSTKILVQCALFLAMAVAAGIAAGYSSDKIAKEFVAGAKDIFSAAMIIGLAAGIIVILKNAKLVDIMLNAMAAGLQENGRAGALGAMYSIQTFINLFIPSASAKAAATMPIMAPFADMIGVSRQATVLAFQFGDGFTNMITPCSGVLMAVLSVANIPYERWFGFIWKFILALIVIGFLLLLPTICFHLPGF